MIPEMLVLLYISLNFQQIYSGVEKLATKSYGCTHQPDIKGLGNKNAPNFELLATLRCRNIDILISDTFLKRIKTLLSSL